jgi:hypothetical protein
MAPQSEIKNSLLVDVFSRPGEYVHGDFEDSDVTSLQGIVWMPNKSWLYGQAACAAQLLPIGMGQIIVGSIVIKYDSLRGSSGNSCGACTVVSGLLAIVCAIMSYLIWKMFEPIKLPNGKLRSQAPTVSVLEQSFSRDPRR